VIRGLIRFVLWTAILLGGLVGILRVTAIRWWRVPGSDPYLEASIAPTLRAGDLVLLWRFTPPKFGDLVVCPEPNAPERVVIGRLVAEPRDQLTVNGDRMEVNNHRISTERGCEAPTFNVIDPHGGGEVTQQCDVEALGGHLHLRGSTGGHLAPKPFSKTVGEGMVFLLSDNRLFPYDSRDYGSVERVTCKEAVIFRIVPKEGFKDLRRFTFIQ